MCNAQTPVSFAPHTHVIDNKQHSTIIIAQSQWGLKTIFITFSWQRGKRIKKHIWGCFLHLSANLIHQNYFSWWYIHHASNLSNGIRILLVSATHSGTLTYRLEINVIRTCAQRRNPVCVWHTWTKKNNIQQRWNWQHDLLLRLKQSRSVSLSIPLSVCLLSPPWTNWSS